MTKVNIISMLVIQAAFAIEHGSNLGYKEYFANRVGWGVCPQEHSPLDQTGESRF